nr:MucR family transcriptional regulator [Acetobacter oeni]
MRSEFSGRYFVADISDKHTALLASVTQIVTAHLSNGNTALPTENVPAFIREVHATIRTIAGGQDEPAEDTHQDVKATLVPAVPIDQSVSPDYIICLEDGKQLKMLKRHLMSRYQLTPAQYRERWNLPKDYPMVAPAYAERRAAVARDIGLGRKGRTPTPEKTVEKVVATAEVMPPETTLTDASRPAGSTGRPARRSSPAKSKQDKPVQPAPKKEQPVRPRAARRSKQTPSEA